MTSNNIYNFMDNNIYYKIEEFDNNDDNINQYSNTNDNYNDSNDNNDQNYYPDDSDTIRDAINNAILLIISMYGLIYVIKKLNKPSNDVNMN